MAVFLEGGVNYSTMFDACDDVTVMGSCRDTLEAIFGGGFRGQFFPRVRRWPECCNPQYMNDVSE